jgi:hypothetical protein
MKDSSTNLKSPENNSEHFTVPHNEGLYITDGCVTFQPAPMLFNHKEFSSLGASHFGLRTQQCIIGTRGAVVTAGRGRQNFMIRCNP